MATNQEVTAGVLEAMHALLKPRGFRKNGQLFTRPLGDVDHLVQLQKGTSSTAARVSATVNLAVWVRALAPVRAGRPDPPEVAAAHWSERLGFTMPDRRDVWWPMASAREAEAAAQAIAEALERHGLPALDRIPSQAALRDLWRAGAGGLTDGRRIMLLAQLERIEGAS